MDEKPILLPLLQEAANGKPRRVRLRFHHPRAYCECPSFGLSDYPAAGQQPEIYDGLAISDYVNVDFPDGAPNGHLYTHGKHIGRTQYEMTGYFSGRIVHEKSPEEDGWYPEFCVEDWCYRPDPDPPPEKEGRPPSDIAADRAEYARLLAEMKRDGAKRCAPAQP